MKKLFTFFALILCSSVTFAQNITEEDFQNMLSELNADSIKATMQTLENFPSRFAAHGNRDVAEYIAGRFEAYGLSDVQVDSFYVNQYTWLVGDTLKRYMYNVKGSLKGSRTPEKIVILGAHLDCITADSSYTIFYDTTAGADDNASGVAVMLEVARVFHEHNFVPRFTIDFMGFDGEEFGLWGSNYDARKRLQNMEHVELMLNNDMVANDPDHQRKMDLLWYDNALQARSDASLMIENFTTLRPVIFDAAGNGNSKNSDSYCYYLMGYKAVFAMEDDFSPYYHGPRDLTQYCDFGYAAEVAKMDLAMLVHYAYCDVFNFEEDGIEEYSPAINGMKAYPNPTTGNVDLSFFLAQGGQTHIALYNMTGQMVDILYNGKLDEGYNHLDFNLCNVPSGIYFCRIQNNNSTSNVKIIKQ